MKKYVLLLSFFLAVADVQCAEKGAAAAAAAAPASPSRQSSDSQLRCKVATEQEGASSGARIDLEAESFVFNELGILRFIEKPKFGGCFFVVFDTEEEACEKKAPIIEIYRKKMPLIIDQVVRKEPSAKLFFRLIVKIRNQYFSESQIDAMVKDRLSVHDLKFLSKKNELLIRKVAGQDFATIADPNGSRFAITEEFMDAQVQRLRKEFDLQKAAILRLLAAAALVEAKSKDKAPKKGSASAPAVAPKHRKTASQQRKESFRAMKITSFVDEYGCSQEIATLMFDQKISFDSAVKIVADRNQRVPFDPVAVEADLD